MVDGYVIVEITATETHALRRRILRDTTPTKDVEFDGDDDPTTFHLGALRQGELVVTSTWMRRRYPDRPAVDGCQLRGMASAPEIRGTGVAAWVLSEGLDRCVRAGAGLVWARARDAALGFYLRFGFEVVGRGYVDLATQLPHHDIVREFG